MNKRIKELAEQAEEWVCKNYPDAMDDNDEFHAQTMHKLAELVVGHAIECVRDVLRDENSDLGYAAASQVQNRIKEHFGVEQ